MLLLIFRNLPQPCILLPVVRQFLWFTYVNKECYNVSKSYIFITYKSKDSSQATHAVSTVNWCHILYKSDSPYWGIILLWMIPVTTNILFKAAINELYTDTKWRLQQVMLFILIHTVYSWLDVQMLTIIPVGQYKNQHLV